MTMGVPRFGEKLGFDMDYGYSVRANSRGTCIDSWYHGTSAHMMDGWDGKRYYAFTSNRAYVSGC